MDLRCVRFLSLIVALSFTFIAGCGGSGSSSSSNRTLIVGYINVIHAIEDAPVLASKADDTRLRTVTSGNTGQFDFGQSSGDLFMETGERNVTFVALLPDGDDEDLDDDEQELLTESFDIKQNEITSWALVGTLAAPRLIAIPTASDNTIDDIFHITMTNLSASFPAIDVYILYGDEKDSVSIDPSRVPDVTLDYAEPTEIMSFSTDEFRVVITAAGDKNTEYYRSEVKSGYEGSGLAWVITPYTGPQGGRLTLNLYSADTLSRWDNVSKIRFGSLLTSVSEAYIYLINNKTNPDVAQKPYEDNILDNHTPIATLSQYGALSALFTFNPGVYTYYVAKHVLDTSDGEEKINKIPIEVKLLTVPAGTRFALYSGDSDLTEEQAAKDDADLVITWPIMLQQRDIPSQFTLQVTNGFFKQAGTDLLDQLTQKLSIHLVKTNGDDIEDANEQPSADNKLTIASLPFGFFYTSSFELKLNEGQYYLWFKTDADTDAEKTFGPVVVNAVLGEHLDLLLLNDPLDDSLTTLSIPNS